MYENRNQNVTLLGVGLADRKRPLAFSNSIWCQLLTIPSTSQQNTQILYAIGTINNNDRDSQ